MPKLKGFRKPVVKVWRLRRDLGEEKMNQIFGDIVAAFAAEPRLNVEAESDIVVLFPADLMSYGLGTEIIIEVEEAPCCFFGDCIPLGGEPNALGQQMEEVRRTGRFQLASRLVLVLERHFPESYIQCRVYSEERPDDGVCSRELVPRPTE